MTTAPFFARHSLPPSLPRGENFLYGAAVRLAEPSAPGFIVGFSIEAASLRRGQAQPFRQIRLVRRRSGRGRGRARDALSYLARLPLLL